MVSTPMGYILDKGFVKRLKKFQIVYDKEYARQMGLQDDEGITPVTEFGKRVYYKVVYFEELINSEDMTFKEHIMIAQYIEQNYLNYDSFIVLHGQDTIGYTASSLSFILENLNKPVILTGSQIPLIELKNDALDNFLGSLLIAGQYRIPEVTIFFGNVLLRGNRATKISTSKVVAFNSPNLDPLAEVGMEIKVHWNRIMESNFDAHLNVFTNMCDEISTIVFTPYLDMGVIDSIIQNSKGVVLMAYGMGNIPTNLINIFKKALSNNVIIVVMTQCQEGTVSDNKELVDLGAVLAFDMTLECIISKLSYLLGKNYSSSKVKKMMM